MLIPESIQKFLDYISVGTVVGAIVGILPNLATLLTIVWMALRVYESKTVQKLLGRSPDDTKS